MTERSVTHATFCIERTLDASPARVFKAFADPAAKAKWFNWPEERRDGAALFDFRVGGRERNAGREPGGRLHEFNCVYQDIVPDQRIVYTYDMHMDGTKTSVSVTTIELKSVGAGTRLVFTEQGAFLDGHDSPKGREEGSNDLMDAMIASVLNAKATV